MTTTTGTSTTSTSAAAAAAAAGLNDKIQQRAKASLFRKIITYYATYQPQDVLLGRGWIANHVGNRVYRRLIDMNRTTYRELQMACDHRLVKDTQVHCQKKQQKQEQEQRRQEQEQSPHELRDRLVESIVLAIFNNGGRFLKNHRSTGMWVEISFKEAIGKTKQALQDRRRKTRGCGNSSGNHHQNNNNHTDNDINNDNDIDNDNDKNRGNRNASHVVASSTASSNQNINNKNKNNTQAGGTKTSNSYSYTTCSSSPSMLMMEDNDSSPFLDSSSSSTFCTTTNMTTTNTAKNPPSTINGRNEEEEDENDNDNDEDMVEVDKNNNTPPPPAGGDDYDDDEKENHNKQQQQQNNDNKDELPKIVGRLTDQVEIVQPPSGLSVLLLRPACVGPLLFTKEKHRRVPSPNTELTEFSFVCHVLFLKRFVCSIDCPILLQVYKYIV